MTAKLTDEEKQKIEEEEKVRAEARAKYSVQTPPTVQVKKKTSCLAIGCSTIFGLMVLGFVVSIAIGSCTGKLNSNKGSSININNQLSEDQQKLYELVTISSSTIEKNAIGTPEWHVTIYNGTDKTIDAVTIDAHFKNNFDEPVGEWNIKKDEAFRGAVQEKINPGANYSAMFNLAVYESTTKVENEKIYRIHFTDGQEITMK